MCNILFARFWIHSSANDRFHYKTSGSVLVQLQLNSTLALLGQGCIDVNTSVGLCTYHFIGTCVDSHREFKESACIPDSVAKIGLNCLKLDVFFSCMSIFY